MSIELDLNLETSALLRASVDERYFRVWDISRHGEFVRHREQKVELERLVEQVVSTATTSELRSLARHDGRLMRGSTFRGPETFDPDTGDVRVIAVRQVERAIYEAQTRLVDAAYLPPTAKDRACQAVPKLFERLETKHLLLPLTRERISGRTGGDDRAFCLGDFAVFPHPALRPARELVHDLCALAWAGADVKVAIDPHSVVRKTDVQGVGLFDYWFGMKLHPAGLDDMTALGHTLHARREDQQALYGSPLLRTDFCWSAYSDSAKSLEVQETVPRTAVVSDHGYAWRGSRYVQNRYVHSIRDTALRRFVHLDGAAKAFPRDHYGPTIREPGLPQGEPLYRKLFRIDGPIPDDEWGRLVAHFFRGNELVIEYFGEILDERIGAQPTD